MYYNQKSLQSMKSRSTRMEQIESLPQQESFMSSFFDASEQIQSTQAFSSMMYAKSFTPTSTSQNRPGYDKRAVRGMEGFANDSDPEYDLGKDGAFSDFSVIVGCFYTAGMSRDVWEKGPGMAFKQKGFNVDYIVIDSESNYSKYLSGLMSDDYDVAWLISDIRDGFPHMKDRLVEAVMRFHRTGRGLMIWADNDPAIIQPNFILPELCGVHLMGSNYGDRVLGYGASDTPGEFDEEHVIFAGLNYLYEGVTICYPVMLDGSPIADGDTPLKTIATSTDSQPCIAYMESTETTGRVILDTGFTKLFEGDEYYGSAGQARYVINAAVYLVDVERRFGESTVIEDED